MVITIMLKYGKVNMKIRNIDNDETGDNDAYWYITGNSNTQQVNSNR